MATFYVLPSRHILGQRFGELLVSLFPGTRFTAWDWPDLAEALGGLVEEFADAYVVYREELDESMSVKDSLLHHFGADLHDEIVEIQIGPGLTQFLHQHWATERTRNAA